MRSKLHIIVIGLFITIAGAYSQISLNKVLKNVKKNAEKQIEQRIERKADKAVDKTLDKAEESIDNTVKNVGKKKDEDKETKDKNIPAENEQEKQETPTVEKASPVLTWNKYDFVPGTEIIFEDDFSSEQNGEFPSRWDMTAGTIEVVNWGGENVVWFKNTNANSPNAILPLLKNRTEDYLPEQFTVEMDVYFHKDYNLNRTYYLFFYDKKNQMKIMQPSKPIRIDYNAVTYDLIGDTYPGHNKLKPNEGWRHVAISFNKRALKGYLDDTRLLNIPNLEINPTGIMISAHNTSGTGKPFIKNVRIAKGAVPLYDKFLTNGKFVTTGIKFDVAKASIKPESMGTINYVVKMMTDHPELNFSVEGHTDSDGESASNQKLSEARAKAVTETMINAGISADRLSSKGYGETKPMTSNDTPEGKAQNRRVEFVKF
jgi:outer membrane protein OmpA-like peptidoglycan-associated protein/chromatin remodeling complex protein RSC6